MDDLWSIQLHFDGWDGECTWATLRLADCGTVANNLQLFCGLDAGTNGRCQAGPVSSENSLAQVDCRYSESESTFYALSHLPVADVLTLTNTYPLWIVLIGFLIWGETVEPSILIAIASALVGVVLIQQPHMEGNRAALASALAAATFTAVAMMGLNRLGQIDPRAVVTHFSGVAALIMIPVILLGHPVDWKSMADPVTVLLLFGVGITGTIGQIFLTKAYAAGSGCDGPDVRHPLPTETSLARQSGWNVSCCRAGDVGYTSRQGTTQSRNLDWGQTQSRLAKLVQNR